MNNFDPKLFNEIEKFVDNKDIANARKVLDVVISQYPQFLKQNFYSLQSRIFRLSAKIYLQEHDVSRWGFYSLACLSQNFISYLPNFQNEFLSQIDEIGNAEISLLASINMTKINKRIIPAELIDESIADELNHFKSFQSPFTVTAYFNDEYSTKENPFYMKLMLFSSVIQDLKISELAIYTTTSKIGNIVEDDKIVFTDDDIFLSPQKAVSLKKEFRFDSKTTSIMIKYASLSINCFKLYLPIKKDNKIAYDKIFRVPDISRCHMSVDQPPLGITNVPFPFTIKMSLDKNSPSLAPISPFQISYQISPFEPNQHCYSLDLENDDYTVTQSVVEEKEQITECNIVFFVTSEDAVYPNHISIMKNVPFYHPFKVNTRCFDENGNELTGDDKTLICGEQYLILTHFYLKIDVAVTIESIEVESIEGVTITSIPLEEKVDLNLAETFTFSMFISSDIPSATPQSLAAVKVKYSPKVYFNAPNSVFIHNIPETKVVKRIVSVEMKLPSMATQYQPHSAIVRVQNDTDTQQNLQFAIQQSKVVMIEGFMRQDFIMQPRESHDISFSFIPINIGQLSFPTMTLTNGNDIVWKASPDMFVMFASC